MTHANDFAAGGFAGGDGLSAATEVALLRGAAGDAGAGAGPWVALGAVMDMEAVAATGAEGAVSDCHFAVQPDRFTPVLRAAAVFF